MWIYFSEGRHVSAVQDRDDPKAIIVRGRTRLDVRGFLGPLTGKPGGYQIYETTNADYRWRAWIARGHFARRLAELAEEVDYPDYKSTCQNQERAIALCKIWSIWREAVNGSE